MISGSWPGPIYVFAGDGKGGFAKPETIKGRDGKNLKAGKASAVAVVDWDRDGDLDLLVGNIGGNVSLIPNEGTREKPVFGAPSRVEADGEPISAMHGDAGPLATDWDGDGHVDLLVGAGDGSVRFYRNTAPSGATRLAAPLVLVPGAASEKPPGSSKTDRGMRAKVCAADWNGDGRLDLLLGDYTSSRGKEPELTPEQRAERDRLEKEQEEVSGRYGKAYERIDASVRKELGLEGRDELSDEDQDRLEERRTPALDKDGEYQEVSKAYSAVWEKLRPLTPPFESHGRVWVFLRKASKPAGTASAR